MRSIFLIFAKCGSEDLSVASDDDGIYFLCNCCATRTTEDEHSDFIINKKLF